MTADELAKAFREIVRRDLANHIAAIDATNSERALNGDGDTCATHDYCDANMLMIQAWESVMGRPMRPHVDSDSALWNQAWQIARATPFAESSNA